MSAAREFEVPGAIPDRDHQRELQRRIEFERRLSSASADLIRAGNERLDSAIVDALGSIGGFLDIDRAYVFVFDDVAATQSNTHEWTAPGISAEAENLQNLPIDLFPWLLARLRSDETVQVDRVSDLPAEAANERAEFEREGIQSILIMPLWRGETLHGFVGFDAVRNQLAWGEDYVIGLRLLAQMFAGALASRALSQRLQAMAFHDPLTGLANRKLLDERFGGALQRNRRRASGAVLAVVDLDDFKHINDRYGHAMGDLLLCEVARRLCQAVRETDTVARLGGDEFVLVVESVGETGLDALGQRLLDVGQNDFELDGRQLRIGLSVGLVLVEPGSADRDALLRRADAAMYEAKRAGKNRWVADVARQKGRK
jgi:diguanylate cyclase (GGDEF)-like protein